MHACLRVPVELRGQLAVAFFPHGRPWGEAQAIIRHGSKHLPLLAISGSHVVFQLTLLTFVTGQPLHYSALRTLYALSYVTFTPLLLKMSYCTVCRRLLAWFGKWNRFFLAYRESQRCHQVNGPEAALRSVAPLLFERETPPAGSILLTSRTEQ